MIAAQSFKDKHVALFGLGGSGIATAQSLMDGGAKVIAWDDNPESVAKAAAAGIATGDLRLIDWSSCDCLILSPGVPLTHPKPHWTADLANAAKVAILGDVEIFGRERASLASLAPFIAITGTNGKSTTTALISHILQVAGRNVQMGGNIGRAVLTLDPISAEKHYVVECSSYQIDLAPGLRPSVGILLNISPDHIDRHGTLKNYAAIKARLVAASDLAVLGIDDEICAAIADQLEADGVPLARISASRKLDDGLYTDGENLIDGRGGKSRVVASLVGIGSLRGQHNAQNALAAITACLALELSDDQIQAGLSSFPGLVHRMEQVGRRGETLFVNDSKATNADASARALSSFENIRWIVGGLPKEGGIETLREFFPKITKAYLIGEAAPAFAATLGEDVPFEISGNLLSAVNHAAKDAEQDGGSVVLLSPACASFDQFKNFELRGEAFREAVLALTGITSMNLAANGAGNA